jgi:hypothetical protein
MLFILGYLTIGVCSLLYLDYQNRIIHGTGIVESITEKTAVTSNLEPTLGLRCLTAIILTFVSPIVLLLTLDEAQSLGRKLLDKAEEYRNKGSK